MATLSQLYNAYLQDDPNVGEMTYDPFGWNIPQTFADQGGDGGGGGGGNNNTPEAWQDDYNPITNPDPNNTRMPSKYDPYPSRRAEGYNPNLSGTMNMKHMEMYPNYYNRPVKNNLIEQGFGLAKNTFIGHGLGALKGIIESILPMNKTAIMNNEMLGQGFAVDNMGRIARVDQGDVNTVGNVMAGRHVSRMSEETFADRIAQLEKIVNSSRYKSLVEEGRRRGELKERLEAVKAAREAWRRANIKTGNVYHAKYKDRPDYRMLDTKYEEEMNDPKMLGDLPVYDPEIDYEKTGTPGYIRSRGANIDAAYWTKNIKDKDARAEKIKEIKKDVTGMYTDDSSGNDPGGGTEAPSDDTAWTDSFSGGHDYGGGGEFDMPSNDSTPDQGEQSSDAGFSDPSIDDVMARGGRVGLNLGGLASILSREGSADGGRIGFFEGGDMSAEDWAAAEAYGDSLPDPSWSVDNNPPDNIDNNVVDTGNNVVDVDLLSTKPSVEITPTDYQKYMANLDLIKSIKEKELEGQVGATIGPVDFTTMIEGGGIGNTNLNYGNWSANISPNADINQISYNRNIGDWELAANYGDGNYGINLSKPFKHGGLARLL